MNIRNGDLAVIGAWFAVLLAAIVAYLPGLDGPFVLDDVLNIAALGDHGGVSDWETFKAFVFGGHAGPTGRPLALVTFLADATNWPADPYSFKRTNLIIHLLNGILLGILTLQLLSATGMGTKRARWIALIAAACWMLHPFLISTTLYVVQRMAELATTFTFAGLITYVYGRVRLNEDTSKAYLVMSIGLAIFTLLAVLSKENGVLLPLLAGVIEFTVFANYAGRRPRRAWSVLFLAGPPVVVLLFLLFVAIGNGIFEPLPRQDYSVYERTLTQGRVLLDYLRHWFFPDMFTAGVFQDHVIKSTSLVSPISTLFSWLFHFAAIAAALVWRRRWPLFALAVLFFYAGHALESTFVGLEMYYEHRNYTATAFLFLPIIVLLADRLDARAFAAVAVVVLLVFAAFTHRSATIWSNYPDMVEAAAEKAPTSIRAQARYATNLYNAQRYQDALTVLDNAIANIPGAHAELFVNRLYMMCNLGVLTEDEFARVAPDFRGLYFRPGLYSLYNAMVESVVAGSCPDVQPASVRAPLASTLENALNTAPGSFSRSRIHYLLGVLDIAAGDRNRAMSTFDESLSGSPDAILGMRIARQFAVRGFSDDALDYADRVAALLADGVINSASAGVTSDEVEAFRRDVISARDLAPDPN